MNGVSSLLFLISALESIMNSSSYYWIASNCLLPISSYLYNATKNNTCLNLDLLTIFLIGCSYINNKYINSILVIILAFNLNLAKNIAFILSIIFLLIKSYPSTNFNILLGVVIIGVVCWMIRCDYPDYYILFTLIWHICILTILCIASQSI